MANSEHLEILNQGVETWNKWRRENPAITPDLTYANLAGQDLSGIMLFLTDLSNANLQETNLLDADLFRALLWSTHFINANLENISLCGAISIGSDFEGANLHRANLYLASFAYTNLDRADLSECVMFSLTINDCSLSETNFINSFFGNAVFADCNLSQSKGLDKTIHRIPSTIGIDTISKSGGKIPEAFLRGCGVPEYFIVDAKSLTTNPIEYYSCFISFTEKDDAFSESLYNDLQAKGIRCWRWKEDAKWGRPLRKEVEAAVLYYDKLVVICSESSLRAPAVLEEVKRALHKEDMLKRKGEEAEVLFPIRIDDFIFDGWESELKVPLIEKNIGDFRDWNGNAEKYRKSVERLVRDLNRPRK